MLVQLDQVRWILDQEIIQERLATFVMEDEDDDDDNSTMLFDGEGEDGVDKPAAISDGERQLQHGRNHQHAIYHVEERKLTMSSHHGHLDPLPSDWGFPSMTWYQLIKNWFLGNQRENLPPIIDPDSKLVKHYNLGSGNQMGGNVVSFMMIVEMEALKSFARKRIRENGPMKVYAI